jgi:hypothetical protein
MDVETMERIRLHAQRAVADARAIRARLTLPPPQSEAAAMRMEDRLEREHRLALDAMRPDAA